MPGWAALAIAIGVLALSMFGGAALYQHLAAGLQDQPALDRSVLNLCIVGPLYAAALAALAYERRGPQPANTETVGALGVGLIIGLVGFGLAFIMCGLFGAVSPGGATASLDHRLSGMAIGAVIIIFQAYGEELFFRGWLQPVLATRWGPWIGLGASSILFAAAHTLGRPISPVAVANDALAGMVFGLLAFRSGGLAAPFAAHFGWNWAEQSLLGLTPNPGVDPLGSLWDFDLVGSPLLGAGPDEMNGALPATLALLVLAALALAWTPRRQAQAVA
ncbi:MAG TPA: CPBP family intramembrane glutamic endopeptidase [Caulobacteraceae bacterium]